MEDKIRNIIKEEFESVMDKRYSEDEVNDAIFNKHFIHTKNGNVYCPVKLYKGVITGVNSDSQHFNIPLDEVEMIESAEERFGRR
jgi:hypothetical protein